MLTGPYFKPFIGMINLSQYSFALPFRWNHRKNRLEMAQSRHCYVMMNLGGLISTVYCLVLIYDLLTSFTTMSPALSMILIMWLVINSGVVLSKLFVFKLQTQMRDFFNFMIAFETNYFSQEGMYGLQPNKFLHFPHLSHFCELLLIFSH